MPHHTTPRACRALVQPIAWLLWATTVLAAESVQRGEVVYQPPAKEDGVPPKFRLDAHRFPYELKRLSEPGAKIEIHELKFPSPVTTPHVENNTVHCELYRLPTNARANVRNPVSGDNGNLGGKGASNGSGKKRPGVIVLHILGGDFPLSRLFATGLAQGGCEALFVKMPYYGPRRPSGVRVRMVSEDPRKTVEGMTQAILDIRRAAAWLGSQPTVDDQQLGVFGISLGGITAALAATAEPRFAKVCPMLAGGDIGQVAWESPELARVREQWKANGGDKESLFKLMREIDPVTYAANLRGRPTQILMLNATHDEIIPRRCTDSLWTAFGQPRIVWYNAGHISALKYVLGGVREVTTFFQPSDAGAKPRH